MIDDKIISVSVDLTVDQLIKALNRNLSTPELALFIAKLELEGADWCLTEMVINHFDSIRPEIENEVGRVLKPKNLLA